MAFGAVMGVKQVKVDVNSLSVGMFVSGLDRPWTQTPFPLQGFYIRDAEDIVQLQQYCKFVTVDVEKQPLPVVTSLKVMSKAPPGRQGKPLASSEKKQKVAPQGPVVTVPPVKVLHNHYPVQEPLKKEVKKAEQLHQEVFSSVTDVVQQLDAGEAVSLKSTRRAASAMVDSILRHPDALTWLARVKDVDEHTYSHSVRSAVWAIIFGRHIGMGKEDLDLLAMGVLLKDIGKSHLDRELLEKHELTAEEEKQYQQFVALGVEMLRSDPAIEPRVISVVKNHCERLNGTGFPAGLKGGKIPVSARIAGMVSFYDEITHSRGGNRPLSPSRAVSRLYECRNREFQEDLVVEFIRAIGLYPTGTLVELSTGEVAIVVEQNTERRLKPKVLIVLDACKKPLQKPLMFDLAQDERDKQALVDSGKADYTTVGLIEIATDLEQGSFDIDVAEIREKYLFKNERNFLKGLFGRS